MLGFFLFEALPFLTYHDDMSHKELGSTTRAMETFARESPDLKAIACTTTPLRCNSAIPIVPNKVAAEVSK